MRQKQEPLAHANSEGSIRWVSKLQMLGEVRMMELKDQATDFF